MKQFKKLLIPIIILVVLLIIVGVVYLTKNKNNNEDVSESSFSILDVKVADLSTITIEKKEKDTLVINSFTNADGSPYFTIDGVSDSQEDYSQDFFKSYMTVMLDFVADTKIDSTGLNLADYGLDNPEVKLTYKTKTNGDITVSLGNDTPSGGKCYCMISGDSNIYTVATMKKTMGGYDSLKFAATVSVGVDFKKVTNIVFERKTDNLKIECTSKIDASGNNVFDIYTPIKTRADGPLIKIFGTIGNLQIASLLELTDEEVKEYGLDDPTYHFAFTMDDGSVKEIYLSAKTNNGLYYGYGSMVDHYFVVSAEQIEDLELTATSLVDPYVFRMVVSDIKKVEVHLDDGRYFICEYDTEDKIATEKATCLLDGRNAKIFNSSGRSYAAILFEAMACIPVGEVDLEATPVLENPVLTMKVIDKSFNATDIAFVKRDTASFYTFINGEYSGYIVYSSALYNDGGTDTRNYGIVPAYELLTTAIENNLNGIYDMEDGE